MSQKKFENIPCFLSGALLRLASSFLYFRPIRGAWQPLFINILKLFLPFVVKDG
jgi:hypothetical protein